MVGLKSTVKKFFFTIRPKFGNKLSVTSRNTFRFQSGDEAVYKAFLTNTVYTVPTLALAMSLGYAAVVISRLKDKVDTGTVIVNLCGASSTGKTTVEELLISAFACPLISNGDGLIRNFHSTQNATFAALAGIHGLPIALDDTTSNNYLNLSNLIYTLATGEEKGRCNSEGELKNSGSGWSGLIVISSETPIQEQDCENQGLKVRVLQTQGITWTPDAKTAELIKKVVRENYGFTGIEFAKYIEQIPKDDLYTRFISAQSQVNALMTNRDNLSDRLEIKYTAIYLTILLMNECFNLKLDANELMTILLKPEQENVTERDISKKALNVIKDFIITKQQHFKIYRRSLQGDGKYVADCGSSGDNYGTIRFNDSVCEVFISTAKVDDLLKSNHINEVTTVKTRWKAAGITKCDKDRFDCKFFARRCIHFIFPIGTNPEFCDCELPETKQKQPNTQTPVCDINYDDSEEIDKIFQTGGKRD